MKKTIILWGMLFIFITGGFNSKAHGNSSPAQKALIALQSSQFKEAERLAVKILKRRRNHSQANLIIAITTYKRTMHAFSSDVRSVLFGTVFGGNINIRYIRWSLEQTDTGLAKADKYLEQASRDPKVSLILNLSRWRVDWNRNGRLDRGDKQLFQIEYDAEGKRLPDGDPRRTPTFRFDRGDVYWARAMLAFQRSVINILLAYDYSEIPIGKLLNGSGRDKRKNQSFTLRLTNRKRMRQAKKLILQGLAFADRSRSEYLKEKDDDREWLPNPVQKDHPLPLPVDRQLYKTWQAVVGDLKRLVQGKEGLSVSGVAQLGDHQWENPPKGYINIGGFLNNPGDIVLNFSHMRRFKRSKSRRDAEQLLKDLFGKNYVRRMKPTPLLSRFLRMRNEIQHGEESFERKLRYLIWLN